MFDYARGHIETTQEYMQRGGLITRVPSNWSRHLTEDETLLIILCGGSGDDAARGYANADLPIPLRDTIAGRSLETVPVLEKGV